ncbi:MAG TPA: nuclear transport factor 2 family protein [Caulobacter sp.]|nr:nuclear transport factor 2 family protein [Caulobacter sp.]
MDARKTLLTRFFQALDRQDIEGALAVMHPDADIVDQLEGERRVGHAALRDYWTGAFRMIRSENVPKAFQALEGGALRVTVHHHVTSPDGALWHEGPVDYRVEFRDGLISRIDQLPDG